MPFGYRRPTPPPPEVVDEARGEVAAGFSIPRILEIARKARALRDKAEAYRQLQLEKEALAGAARAAGQEQEAEQLQAEAEFSASASSALEASASRRSLVPLGIGAAVIAALAFFTK